MAARNSSNTTQVFHVLVEGRKFDHSNKFEDGESLRICLNIMKESGAYIEISSCEDQSLTFLVTGKQNEVLEARRRILTAFQNQAKKEVYIPKEHHGWILGTQGQRWKELELTTATNIQIPSIQEQSDIITITGTKEGIEKAEIALKSFSAERANIVTNEVVIPPEFCNSLKRTARKEIQSIMEHCDGVVIKFPTFDSCSDKVTISGSRDSVEKAQQQLLKLFNDKLLSSFTTEFRAKVQHHKFLIGKNGANIKKIRESTGVQIMFPTEKDEDKEVITIIGKEDAIDEAKAELESTIKKVLRLQSEENITESEININAKHHGHFLARRGEVLHRIEEDCGRVQISFPRGSIEGDRVVIKGSLECVRAAKERMLEIVRELESMVTIECEIPRKHRRVVIGARGCKVQAINAEFHVQIRFPDRYGQEEQCSGKQGNDAEAEAIDIVPVCDVVRITGKSDNTESAKQALLNLVPITIEVDVPNYLHRSIIGYRGRDVKELMEKYDVFIVLSRADQTLDYVTITGTPAHVEKAKEAILEKYKNLEAQHREIAHKSFELKIEVDSEYHPKIIDHSGAVINKITSDHDVQLNFPCIGDAEENIVTITGCEKNVRNARDDIMKIINELEQKYSTVIGQVSTTQHKHADCEISLCESPTLSSDSDIIGCKGIGVSKRTQELSNVYKDFTNAEDDIRIESIEEVEKVQTEMQMLHQKLQISWSSMTLIRQHTDVITDVLKYCEDGRNRFTELYNTVILKQERKMKELRDHLNDQVSTNKALKIERTQLILEIDSEREECEKIIHENRQKYNEETTKMSSIIKDIEANLSREQGEKSKLIVVNNEISERLKELLSKHQALQVTSIQHQKQIEDLKPSLKKLKEREVQVNNKNDELEQNRKHLENLTLLHTKTTIKLREVISNNEELSKTVAKRDKDINRLETALKNKDDKISKLNVDLSNALENNRESFRNIKILNEKLVTKEEQICQVKTDLKAYKANVDEHVTREKANQEAKLEKIRANVYELKEKVIEITQDIHNSTEICVMLNETKNTSNIQSDK